MTNVSHRAPLALVGLAALAVIAATVLVAMHQDVPGWFQTLALAGLAGGAGLAVPMTHGVVVTPETSAPVGVPAPPAGAGDTTVASDAPPVAPPVIADATTTGTTS